MLLLALKRVFPRRLPLALAVTCAVMIANYFQVGHVDARNAILIFIVALAATLLLYLPVEYHNLKSDRDKTAGK
jgi:hypothetical protein